MPRAPSLWTGARIQLDTNDGPNMLHGGKVGFEDKVWSVRIVPEGVEMTPVARTATWASPGKLTAHVRFTRHDRALRIDYSATTDKPTIVNLTTLTRVQDTPLDFRKPMAIGARINQQNEQLVTAGGYDHNFVLNHASGAGLHPAATLYDPRSSRTLTITTTEPGVQFYSGNFLNGTLTGKQGVTYAKYAGLCLETQHFPDSPNEPAFPLLFCGPARLSVPLPC